MHIVSKFQFFIHISIVVKLKNKIPNFKRGAKKGKSVSINSIREWGNDGWASNQQVTNRCDQ